MSLYAQSVMQYTCLVLAFLNVATKNKVLNLIFSNDGRNAYWYLLVTWKNKLMNEKDLQAHR